MNRTKNKKHFLVAILMITTSGFGECEACISLEENCCACTLEPDHCDGTITLFVDALYWYGKETGLSYALKNETVEFSPVLNSSGENIAPFVLTPRDFLWVKESWDPGVRIGGSWSEFCEGWDLSFSWTYFQTKTRQSISVKDKFSLSENSFPLGESLTTPWVVLESSPGTTDVLNFYNEIRATWHLRLNIWDFHLGKTYWLGQHFSIRPFTGVQGGWTKTRFTNQPILDFTTDTPAGSQLLFAQNTASYLNRFWGVGLVHGFQPTWHLGSRLSLCGNGSVSLLWGNFESKRKETTGINISGPFTTLDAFETLGTSKSAFSHMQTILHLGVGLKWEFTDCCERYPFEVKIGWESLFLWNHNHRMQLRGHLTQSNVVGIQEGNSYTDYDETYGDLIVSGVTFGARFGF